MEIKTAIEDIARLMLELAECKERQKELEKQIQNIINDFCSGE